MKSIPEIALNLSEKGMGGQYFMSLITGKRIHNYDWDGLSIDADVIVRVEKLGRLDEQDKLSNDRLFFELDLGVTIGEENTTDVI